MRSSTRHDPSLSWLIITEMSLYAFQLLFIFYFNMILAIHSIDDTSIKHEDIDIFNSVKQVSSVNKQDKPNLRLTKITE